MTVYKPFGGGGGGGTTINNFGSNLDFSDSLPDNAQGSSGDASFAHRFGTTFSFKKEATGIFGAYTGASSGAVTTNTSFWGQSHRVQACEPLSGDRFLLIDESSSLPLNLALVRVEAGNTITLLDTDTSYDQVNSAFELNVGGGLVDGSESTGLANDATVYSQGFRLSSPGYMTFHSASAAGSTIQTYSTLETQILSFLGYFSRSYSGGHLIDSNGISHTHYGAAQYIDTTAAAPGLAVFQNQTEVSAPLGTDQTGLANDATTYSMNVAVDGGGNQLVTVTGSAAQTWTQLIAEINLDITGATAQMGYGGVFLGPAIVSATTGPNSSIVISDVDLVANLVIPRLNIDNINVPGRGVWTFSAGFSNNCFSSCTGYVSHTYTQLKANAGGLSAEVAQNTAPIDDNKVLVVSEDWNTRNETGSKSIRVDVIDTTGDVISIADTLNLQVHDVADPSGFTSEIADFFQWGFNVVKFDDGATKGFAVVSLPSFSDSSISTYTEGVVVVDIVTWNGTALANPARETSSFGLNGAFELERNLKISVQSNVLPSTKLYVCVPFRTTHPTFGGANNEHVQYASYNVTTSSVALSTTFQKLLWAQDVNQIGGATITQSTVGAQTPGFGGMYQNQYEFFPMSNTSGRAANLFIGEDERPIIGIWDESFFAKFREVSLPFYMASFDASNGVGHHYEPSTGEGVLLAPARFGVADAETAYLFPFKFTHDTSGGGQNLFKFGVPFSVGTTGVFGGDTRIAKSSGGKYLLWGRRSTNVQVLVDDSTGDAWYSTNASTIGVLDQISNKYLQKVSRHIGPYSKAGLDTPEGLVVLNDNAGGGPQGTGVFHSVSGGFIHALDNSVAYGFANYADMQRALTKGFIAGSARAWAGNSYSGLVLWSGTKDGIYLGDSTTQGTRRVLFMHGFISAVNSTGTETGAWEFNAQIQGTTLVLFNKIVIDEPASWNIVGAMNAKNTFEITCSTPSVDVNFAVNADYMVFDAFPSTKSYAREV